jgi:hypothetical protein
MIESARGSAIVTGASSGIGAAAAVMLAREGYHVALVARRGDRLRKLCRQIEDHGGRATPVLADLSREAERRRAYRTIKKELPPVEVLINSAGLGWYGHAAEMSWHTARNLMRVNMEAAAHMTLLCLRDMRRRGRGHIITVGSISGGIPSQGIALYGATKAFLDNFVTALHRESVGTGVCISILRPGPVLTEFGATARQQPHGLRVPTERVGVSAGAVADGIRSLLRHPRRVVYIPFWLRAVPWVELSFGWLMDRIGPLLLRAQAPRRT